MTLIVLYLSTALVFLVLDALMLGWHIGPLFRRHLGDQLLENLRWGPAAAFYLAYIAGLLWLVSLPALRDGAPLQALIGGAVLGAMAYGTYEFTSYAVMRDWHWQMVVTDLVWGTVLTGVSAWAGVTITRALTG
ncbi:DUF2177 family protein [Szabonella alba]|uniref:DUF2177 family protein n=1 Tax=Szabonella alba TaxID=2804194 RepID=A0A8K0V8W6_9RHOB|nr:DUF2177 family protein [Szabonella alba]MBL4917647.1 DUF2177 family protein [Szabonella alba]